nr:uncharacterized protein LOC127315642 [Lolium perenne]
MLLARPPSFPQPPSPPRSPHPSQPWTAPPADLRAPAEDHYHELLRATPTRPWEGRHWPWPPPWPTNVGELQPLQVWVEKRPATPRSPALSSTSARATTPEKPASSRRHHLEPLRGPSRPRSGPDGPLRPPAPPAVPRPRAAARRAQPQRPPPAPRCAVQTTAATNAPATIRPGAAAPASELRRTLRPEDPRRPLGTGPAATAARAGGSGGREEGQRGCWWRR